MRGHTTFSTGLGALLACLLQGAVTADLPPTPFHDRDLGSLLREHASGVIYLWSPHMPYSVQGAREAREVAQALGIRSVLLLDPYAEPALAGSAARSSRLPARALRRMRAGALSRMGATQHFPTAVVFAAGRVDALMLPGYTPPGDLRAYILQRLVNLR